MKVFAVMFNPMIEESSFGLISLHKTKEGAERACEEHKEKIKEEENETGYYTTNPHKKWDRWFAWKIEEIEILE
jgi:hypothetical protein